MENIKQNILSANRALVDSKQINVECVINLENEQSIEKVLALTAQTQIREQNNTEKETRFTGEIYLHLFYLTPENQIDSISTICDYGDVFKHDALLEGQTYKARAKIIGVNPNSVSENSLRVLVTVEVDFVLEGNAQINFYENNDEDCKIKLGETTFINMSSTYSGGFESVKTLEIKEKVAKVLMVDSSAIIKNTTAHTGFITVEGDVYNYIVYAKEDGAIVHLQTNEAFKEELEVEASVDNALIEARVALNNKDVLVEIDENEDTTSLKIVSPLKVDARIYVEEEYLTVKDIYSLKNRLETSLENVKSTTLLEPKYFEGKIEGNLTLSENQPRIDKVLTVSNPRYVISNSYLKEDEIFVEGIVISNLVYLNDETESVNSVEVEVPFVTSEKYIYDGKNTQVDVQVALADCDMLAKRGREIYFDCKIKVYANIWQETSQEIISKVEYKEPHKARDSAIEIFFGKMGDTFWDIAKELSIDETLIVGQNPGVKNPLESDEKIVIYYGIGDN